ncbi:hypothetical protein E6O75_ATG04677 [Venturia nashicola]|uniref:LYC1 C-terminal domain-containing protein n=1 Tax=Venturia nashicola TaxID=86259 RepID=A0A4Z1NYS9_9PEZI|nr:hypothetical protein E6O75_ATG04677 [Venturia nashicola]
MISRSEEPVPNGVVTTTNRNPLNLPDSNSPDLFLDHPTEEERTGLWTKNGSMWKGALSLEAYIHREKHLSDQEFTKDGGITWWILVDTRAKGRVILSACESFRKKAFVFQNGKTEDVITHGIGSVFCAPECRRRGYAQRMITLLGDKLRTWQISSEQRCVFSVLYSDIGKKFYADHGWEPFDSSHISLPAVSNSSSNGTANGNGPANDHALEATPLYASDLPRLCAIDEHLIRQTATHAPSSQTYIALTPNYAKISWHQAREDFVGLELHGRKPLIKGAIVGTEPGKRVWCYFNRVWYNPDPTSTTDNTLHILRLVVEEKGAFTWEKTSHEDMETYIPAIAALFKLARKEAHEWNMDDVEIWNPNEATVRAVRSLDPGADIVHREQESIASLMWYGERPNDGPVKGYVDWLANEKYGWC